MRRFLLLSVFALVLLPFSSFASVLCVPSDQGVLVGDDLTVIHPNIDYGTHVYVGTFNVTVDCVTPTQVYCTDVAVSLCLGAQYVQAPNVEDPRIVWILNNYYPAVPGMPSELSTDPERKAAVQLAIWHFSDGCDISQNGTGGSVTAAVWDAARTIIAVAQTATVPPTPTTLELSPAYSEPALGSTVVVTATLKDQNGAVMANVPVSWTASDEHPTSGSGVTDSNGQITASWVWEGYGWVKFNVDYTIPIGLNWVNPGCQNLIQGLTVNGRLIAVWGDENTVPSNNTTWGNIKSLYQ
jgi:TQXA domain-containing protein